MHVQMQIHFPHFSPKNASEESSVGEIRFSELFGLSLIYLTMKGFIAVQVNRRENYGCNVSLEVKHRRIYDGVLVK